MEFFMSLQYGLIHYLFDTKILPADIYGFVLIAATLIVIVASYLLGSINSAIIISKLVYRDDVRRHGSGNPGTTNMLRTFGGKAALLTLIGDMAKTALSILLAGFVFGFYYIGGISMHDGFCYVAGLFSILGHVFPIYYKFKGGKGVLSTATMALILSPIPFLVLLAIFAALVFWTKYVSLGSVSAAVLYPVVISATFKILGQPEGGLIALSTIIVAILIVWCHRANLVRISNRTENKISFGKKKAPEESLEENNDEK